MTTLIGSFISAEWGKVLVGTDHYGGKGGPLAVLLLEREGQHLATLSVNMYRPECSHDSRDLPKDCFYVKEWGENAQLAQEAYNSGLFLLRPDLPKAYSGFVSAPVWQLAD